MNLYRNLLLPSWGILAATGFSAILAGLAAWLLSQQPWLGVKLNINDDQSIVIDQIIKGSPAEGLLIPGDEIMALIGSDNRRFELQASDLVENLDGCTTFEQYRQALQRHETINTIIAQPEMSVQLRDGSLINLHPSSTRPLAALTYKPWLQLFIGMAGFLIATTTLLLRHNSIATQIFFIAGLSFLASAWGAAIYSGRELAIDSELARLATTAGISGAKLLAYSLVALIWLYPKPVSRFPVVSILYVLAIADILRIAFLGFDLPLHTTFIGTTAVIPLGILFSIAQWRQAKHKADHRAILKWMNLSIYIAVFLIIGTHDLPIILSITPLINVVSEYAIVVIIFLGFAFAITRYRLFDIERWWIDIWLWFFAGTLILASDFILAYVIKMNQGVALSLALILVGWLYFPLRQQVWKKLLKRKNRGIEHYLPKIVTALTRSDDNIEQLWQTLLREIFNPLSLEKHTLPLTAPAIDNDGLALLLPGSEHSDGYRLRYADKGRRLFLEEDTHLAASLFNLVFDKQRSIATYMQGVHEERKRILRDLHDDVAGRLLALKLNTNDKSTIPSINEALTALRSVIYSLNRHQDKNLGEASTRWRSDLQNLIDPSKIRLSWDIDSTLDTLPLSAHQILNLERILREAFSNAVHHSKPTEIMVRVQMEGSDLILRVENNSNINKPVCDPGNGLLNIRQRMQEMGGSMEYTNDTENTTFSLLCKMPLEHKA